MDLPIPRNIAQSRLHFFNICQCCFFPKKVSVMLIPAQIFPNCIAIFSQRLSMFCNVLNLIVYKSYVSFLIVHHIDFLFVDGFKSTTLKYFSWRRTVPGGSANGFRSVGAIKCILYPGGSTGFEIDVRIFNLW